MYIRRYWTSLVVQPLRISLSIQGTWIWSLLWEGISPKPMCHNHWAFTLQPVCHNYWSPCALTPVLHNKRSHWNEKSMHPNYRGASASRNEKSPMLTKTFKILQTLCAVYGWEVVNNHVRSSRSVDQLVTQARLQHRGFSWDTPFICRRLLTGALS